MEKSLCSFQSILNSKMTLDQVEYLLNPDDQMFCINLHKILWITATQFDDFFFVIC